jgi:hypothetical protein
MKITDDEMSLVLRGRRLVPEQHGDQYFALTATYIRGGMDVFGAVRAAVDMFSPDREPTFRRRYPAALVTW